MGQNKPLTSAQVKALPRRIDSFVINKKGHLELKTFFDGFTPTAVEPTRAQQREEAQKWGIKRTNRKHTAGRNVQTIVMVGADGTISRKTIWHRDAGRIMNV